MKKAFSLIELIFTIVIAAMIFTVIPKIIFAINKNDIFALKQNAMFNAISLLGIMRQLPWDENNTAQTDILITDPANLTFECNSSLNYRRIGGFISMNGRTCQEQLLASSIGTDSGETHYIIYDDIDDFNQNSMEANLSANTKKYELFTTVHYLSDDTSVFHYDHTNREAIVDLHQAVSKTTPTNIKEVKVITSYAGRRGKEKNITSFHYYSANIGQFYLNKEAW